MKPQKVLQELGLTKEEAEIYLACLKLGEPKISDIAQIVDVPRTSIYVHVKNLAEKGILKKSRREGIERFVAVEPAHLVEDEKERIAELEKAVPLLEQLCILPNKKMKIEYFDCRKGLLRMYEIMAEQSRGKEIFFIEPDGFNEMATNIADLDYWRQWQEKILKYGTRLYGVSTPKNAAFVKTMPDEFKQVIVRRPLVLRLVPQEKMNFFVALHLIPPGLSYLSDVKENFSVSIENLSICNMFRVIFNELYEIGEQFDSRDILS